MREKLFPQISKVKSLTDLSVDLKDSAENGSTEIPTWYIFHFQLSLNIYKTQTNWNDIFIGLFQF